MTNDTTNAKGFTMDNFTFGMFNEMHDYNAREEAAREVREGHTPMTDDQGRVWEVSEVAGSDDDWVEPMDWTDVLNNHNRGLDALERELATRERPEDEDDDRYDFLNQWD